jgi:ribosome biogenesis GTPase A
MRKAERELREKLKLVDVIVEVTDARAPATARNSVLDALVAHKPRVLVLAKADLANGQRTRAWEQALRGGCWVVTADKEGRSVRGRVITGLRRSGNQGGSRGARPGTGRRLRAMVIGMPNVGKSTLINRLVGGKQAATGPRPGVTRHQQWIAVDDSLEMLDTPGVMVPRVGAVEDGLRLGLIDAVKPELIGEQLLAEYLLERLNAAHQHAYCARFDIAEPVTDITAWLTAVAARRGLRQSGGDLDLQRASLCALADFREGKLGRLTLDPAPAS